MRHDAAEVATPNFLSSQNRDAPQPRLYISQVSIKSRNVNMSSRKRTFQAFNEGPNDSEPSLLNRIRNMWQFANLCQWIYIFGKPAKIDESIDVEVGASFILLHITRLIMYCNQEIETECLKPTSPMLDDIALALLKLVSSHRGLT